MLKCQFSVAELENEPQLQRVPTAKAHIQTTMSLIDKSVSAFYVMMNFTEKSSFTFVSILCTFPLDPLDKHPGSPTLQTSGSA